MTLSSPLTATARTVGERLGVPLRVVSTAAWRVHVWAASAEGRRRTQRVLRGLVPGGWQVCNDVELPGGGWVDLAIGRSGTYVLDSELWHGVVTVDLKGATITPADRPSAAWTARGQHRALPAAAAGVVRALAAAAGTAVPSPRPVVVVWGAFPDRVVECGGVSYVAGAHLADWLAGQPARPGGAQVTALPDSVVRQHLRAIGPAPARTGSGAGGTPLRS